MKKKIKQLSLITMLILLVSTSCSNKTVHQSLWHQKKSETIAANAKTDKMLYNAGSGILYNISNDSVALFIKLRISNEIVQKKILMFGLTTWIDTTGKQKRVHGIKYPVGRKEFRGQQLDMKQMRSGNFGSSKHELANKFNKIEIINKKNKNSIEETDKRFNKEINADITFDKLGLMYCKLRIPYKRLNISYNQLTANNPSIGFVTGHLDTQQMQGRNGGGRPGGGGVRPSGGGKPGGGGGRPGGNSNSNPDMQAMQKATSFWLKGIKIATNK